MTRELTDFQIGDLMPDSISTDYDVALVDFARRVIAADRALRVPMTDVEQKFYKAAYRQGLEDAAKVCEEMERYCASDYADAIRALKEDK